MSKCSVSKPISNASQATHTNLTDCSGTYISGTCYDTMSCGSGTGFIKRGNKCIKLHQGVKKKTDCDKV